jgi:glucose/arabinose dehydrogenase
MLRRARTPLLLSITAALALLGAQQAPGSAAGSAALAPDAHTEAARAPDRLEVSATMIDSGLRRPTAIAAPDDGTGRLFITEKAGLVRAYDSETGLGSEPLLDISDRIDTSGNERGLLGIATSPGFADDNQIYVAYTSLPDGDVTLSRFTLGQVAGPADSEEILLRQPHSEHNNHNGGHVTFGPDGYLYLGIGDGGHAGDPFHSGQNLGTLLGKILRVDVSRSCGDRPYCVPESNPFATTPGARGEIWSYGLRNPWKFSFDAGDGSLWIGDVGQGAYEEVNHVPAGAGGANFGWSCWEGPEHFDEGQCRSDAEYEFPVFTYRTSYEGCSIIGGHVYRGEKYAELAGGTYLATDYCSATIWGVRPTDDGAYDSAEIGQFPVPQVTAFGEDQSGELYAVNDLPGQLYRLSFAAAEPQHQCTVEYRVDSEWGTGFTSSVTLHNTGTSAIDEWALAWDFPAGQQVTNAWNAAVAQQDTTVSAAGAEWNRDLGSAGSVTFGFQGAHTGSNPAPAEFRLNGDTCTISAPS